MGEKYDGAEKIAIIEAGAGEYLPWPGTSWEALASCRALIRRYTVAFGIMRCSSMTLFNISSKCICFSFPKSSRFVPSGRKTDFFCRYKKVDNFFCVNLCWI